MRKLKSMVIDVTRRLRRLRLSIVPRPRSLPMPNDTQKIFRVMLEALARPGQLYRLPPVGPFFSSASGKFDIFETTGSLLAVFTITTRSAAVSDSTP